MKKLTFLTFFYTFFLISCQNNASTSETSVSAADVEHIITELKADKGLNKEKIDSLLSKIDDFVQYNPKDVKAPNFLELKAKYLTALGKNSDALAVYETIYSKFTSYENHSDALFMQAFIYENNLQDKEKATEAYRKYLNEFPNGAFAKDAKFALDNINKTPAELMEMFEKMKQEHENATHQ